MANEYVIGYPEYGGELTVLADGDLFVEYLRWKGKSKTEAIHAAEVMRDLNGVGREGFSSILSQEPDFDHWAKDYFRDFAKQRFGFDERLVFWLDDYGSYHEEIVLTEAMAADMFKAEKAKGRPVAYTERKKAGRGWMKDPVARYKWDKIGWRFRRNHFKAQGGLL